jgi:hypothetical protein
MENNKNMTAVEWIEVELKNWLEDAVCLPDYIFEQAKQMEKEQHDLTFARGSMTGYANANGYESVDFEQFYNKTYGK